jgi:glutamate racemase
VVQAVAHRYLDAMFGREPQPDTLVLGCTHFPVLAAAIRAVIGPQVTIVDSAETTATALAGILDDAGLRAARRQPGSVRLLATDGAERFARVGGTFLGRPLVAADVEIVDLPGTGVGNF